MAGELSQAIGDLGRSVSGYWRQRDGYQTFLYGVAALMLASGLFHTVVFLVTGAQWYGPVSWRKPLLFGYSFGVTTLALAWIMTFLPKRRVLGWVLAGSLGVSGVIEVSLITLQRWRNVPSHFNTATPLDGGIFTLMGIMVSVIATVIVMVTIWSLIELRAPAPLALGIRAGLILLVLGQALGGAIIAVGVSQAAGPSTGSTAFGPNGVILGAAGIMKDPHGIALHGIQVLGFLACLTLFTPWSERRRSRTVAVAVTGYSLVLLVILWQTFTGRGPLDLSPLARAGLLAGLAMLLGVAVVVVLGVAKPGRPAGLRPAGRTAG